MLVFRFRLAPRRFYFLSKNSDFCLGSEYLNRNFVRSGSRCWPSKSCNEPKTLGRLYRWNPLMILNIVKLNKSKIVFYLTQLIPGLFDILDQSCIIMMYFDIRMYNIQANNFFVCMCLVTYFLRKKITKDN